MDFGLGVYPGEKAFFQIYWSKNAAARAREPHNIELRKQKSTTLKIWTPEKQTSYTHFCQRHIFDCLFWLQPEGFQNSWRDMIQEPLRKQLGKFYNQFWKPQPPLSIMILETVLGVLQSSLRGSGL